MKHNDPKPADKVPHPLSSEQAQRGEQVPDPVLEQPDADTEAVDKVITPTSIQQQQAENEQIDRRLDEAEGKLRR
ncbi:hypothetical protein [Pseudomonas putida]